MNLGYFACIAFQRLKEGKNLMYKNVAHTWVDAFSLCKERDSPNHRQKRAQHGPNELVVWKQDALGGSLRRKHAGARWMESEAGGGFGDEPS